MFLNFLKMQPQFRDFVQQDIVRVSGNDAEDSEAEEDDAPGPEPSAPSGVRRAAAGAGAAVAAASSLRAGAVAAQAALPRGQVPAAEGVSTRWFCAVASVHLYSPDKSYVHYLQVKLRKELEQKLIYACCLHACAAWRMIQSCLFGWTFACLDCSALSFAPRSTSSRSFTSPGP